MKNINFMENNMFKTTASSKQANFCSCGKTNFNYKYDNAIDTTFVSFLFVIILALVIILINLLALISNF